MTTPVNELDYISVADAVARPGLRVAFTAGLPGPWGVGARAVLEYKHIPFHAVPQVAGGANEELRRWTGQTSAPVAVLDQQAPRTTAAEIVLLAERLAPVPALIPQDAEARSQMFGLLHELAGEDGLGWSLRLILFATREAGTAADPALTRKYDCGRGLPHACARVDALLAMLARRLEGQMRRCRPFLVGDDLSAADFYWTAFSHLLRGFSEDACLMPDFYRVLGKQVTPHLGPMPEILFEHRERILMRYMKLPMRF